MTDYLDLQITADAAELYAAGLEYIQTQEPGWTPSPVENWLLMACAQMASEVAVLTGRVPFEIFKFYGQSVLRVPANQAIAATGTATFTLTDTAGHTIPAGAQLDVDGVGFVTTDDLVIAATQDTGQVDVVALETGAAGNTLSGPAVLIAPTYIFVDAVELDPATAGGADGETGLEYVNRLADELPTLSPKAIYTPEFAILARRDPDVDQALAINRYVPAGPGGTPPEETDVEGAVTVAVRKAGADPGAPVRDRVEAALEGNRVLNIDVHVIPPTETRVDIRFTAQAHDGQDLTVVEAEGEQAILDFINGEQWGRPQQASTDEWVDEPTLRRNDLFGVLYDVPGLRHVNTLTLARYGDPQGTADVALDGPAAIPASDSVVDGTVTA